MIINDLWHPTLQRVEITSHKDIDGNDRALISVFTFNGSGKHQGSVTVPLEELKKAIDKLAL